MAAEPSDPRTFDVSFDIATHGVRAPRSRVQASSPQAEPDRVLERLDRAEHKIEMLESNLAMLASALTGEKS